MYVQYCEIGNEEDWWDPSTLNKFVKKSKCVGNYYGKFVAINSSGAGEEDVMVDGENTLAENIADIGGWLQSYYAYSKHGFKNSINI